MGRRTDINSQRPVIGQPGEEVIDHIRVRQRHPREPLFPMLSLNLTPMIDVVFLLLVYFVIATDFRLGEEMYRMTMPADKGQVANDPFQLEDEPLRIKIVSTGLGADRYSIFIDGPYPQPDTFNSLHEFLTKTQVHVNRPEGMFAPSHPIIIQPTHTTRWEHAMEAFNSAARAGYTNITFAKPG